MPDPTKLEETATRLHALAREVSDLPPPIEDEQLDVDLARNERTLGELAGGEQQFMVVVMGEFSTGKSTLINALIGRQVARMAATIETGHVSHFAYGLPERAVFHLRGGGEHVVSLSESDALLRSSEGRTTNFLATVDRVDVFVDAEPLRTMTLVDTPGLGTVQALHEQITERYLDHAQAVIWVFDANQAGTGTEVTYLRHLGSHRCVIGALNKVDDLDPGEVPAVIEHLQQLAPDVLRAVLPISAYDALAARESGDLGELELSGLPTLLDYLATQVFGRKNLIAEASRQGLFANATQRLYGHVARRRADARQLIEAHDRTAGLLQQRRSALLTRARGDLAQANKQFIADRKHEWEGYFAQYEKDLERLAAAANLVLSPNAMEDHRLALEHRAQVLFDEEWHVTTAQIVEATRELHEAETAGLDRLVGETGQDKASKWLGALGGGAATGAALGAAIAAASAAITIGILPFAMGIGAVGGLGGLVSAWLQGQSERRKKTSELRSMVEKALDHQQQELNAFVVQTVVPAIGERSGLLEQELRSRFRDEWLAGHDLETIRESEQRLGEIEREVRRVAHDHGIDLRGVLPAGAPQPAAEASLDSGDDG